MNKKKHKLPLRWWSEYDGGTKVADARGHCLTAWEMDWIDSVLAAESEPDEVTNLKAERDEAVKALQEIADDGRSRSWEDAQEALDRIKAREGE
jgi:diketogulonate reductase-like aldo/keto reductase